MAEEIYGNDERIEALWAIKAMEHAEVYFNVSCTWGFSPSFLRLNVIFFVDFMFRWSKNDSKA